MRCSAGGVGSKQSGAESTRNKEEEEFATSRRGGAERRRQEARAVFVRYLMM